MSSVPDRTTFENLYAGKAPWDIGKPQRPFAEIADQIASPILDAGCGTGEIALYFASRGHQVVGIDFVDEAIRRASAKAADRKLAVEFLAKDATKLTDWNMRFASAIDCGLFHVFADDQRQQYVRGLAHVLQPGARLYLMCFSDEEPGTDGPRRISKNELNDSFRNGWLVESIEPRRIEVIADLKEFKFSEGGPKAWFAVVRRQNA